MKTIEIGRDKDLAQTPINYKQYIKRAARSTDYSKLITEDVTILNQQKQPVIVYLRDPEMPSQKMIQILQKIEYEEHRRVDGLVSRSRIFGFMPREQIRKDYCSSTALAREMPDEHLYICQFGSYLSNFYKKYCPDIYNSHLKVADERILKDWTIDNSPFTSGIINKNNPLKYHFDSGNISKVYSNMVCFRKDCEGGNLAIPELDIALEIANKSVLLFDGQAIMHGVTPFHITSKHGYRYTLVYYTLKQMWNCQPITEEIARIRTRKASRELKRFKHLTGELDDDQMDILAKYGKHKRHLF